MKDIRVVRYRPAYFSGFDEEDATVRELSDLLAIPWVASWTHLPNFHRFSIADQHLMAELDGGKEFWGVAYFPDGKPALSLPEWESRAS